MPKIKEIKAREVLDSRGNPTVETQITLSNEITARTSVPSGVSAGTYEAVELRDHDKTRFNGMGVLNAVKNVNDLIAPRLSGFDVLDQRGIDTAMITLDGTHNKEKLGANAMLSVSQACLKAAAKSSNLPLYFYLKQFTSDQDSKKTPTLMFNLLEGGKHAKVSLNFQEFLVIPASSKSITESIRIGIDVYHSLKDLLYERAEIVLVADEGGFSPNASTNQAGLTLLREAIEHAGFAFALDAFIGLDSAANSFREGKLYKIADRSTAYDTYDLAEFYKMIISDFSLIYLEDPFAEDDLEGWKKISSDPASKVLLVGDDLTVTNPYRLQAALQNNLIGGVVIKPNQIGTISEAIAVAEIARYKNLKIVVSHRAGETEDDFIADFAVGVGADYVKFGAPARERIVKYNRLLKIEEELKLL